MEVAALGAGISNSNFFKERKDACVQTAQSTQIVNDASPGGVA
jgi:hypothetical protein